MPGFETPKISARTKRGDYLHATELHLPGTSAEQHYQKISTVSEYSTKYNHINAYEKKNNIYIYTYIHIYIYVYICFIFAFDGSNGLITVQRKRSATVPTKGNDNEPARNMAVNIPMDMDDVNNQVLEKGIFDTYQSAEGQASDHCHAFSFFQRIVGKRSLSYFPRSKQSARPVAVARPSVTTREKGIDNVTTQEQKGPVQQQSEQVKDQTESTTDPVALKEEVELLKKEVACLREELSFYRRGARDKHDHSKKVEQIAFVLTHVKEMSSFETVLCVLIVGHLKRLQEGYIITNALRVTCASYLLIYLFFKCTQEQTSFFFFFETPTLPVFLCMCNVRKGLIGKKFGTRKDNDGKLVYYCADCTKKHNDEEIKKIEEENNKMADLISQLQNSQSSSAAANVDHGNLQLIPGTCWKCKEKIFGRGIQNANGEQFHLSCFTCDNCGSKLAGKVYGLLYVENSKMRYCGDCMKESNNIQLKKSNIVVVDKTENRIVQTNKYFFKKFIQNFFINGIYNPLV
ncbi:hypothetical protein RFI_00275 [Reticulomyxa filosa]|uniref:LIM zinc-binding domain-containing protein n=1 Tax=Reticulomyxa filosa TaxID=46433 RepID=X6PGH1_RETFI|nr:hypothetical protein RFI_00275 [Reticulomyxa filosa]|eukprot:ETO36787.1 hypothetical protein RFI_00275 [Reticulomyxa filosa]